MKLNEVLHGFQVVRIRESKELKGTLYEMRHLKTGAELAFLDNKNNNKLFSVAFKTLPWDDTGVFHILEHSVLAGSENYPVKEPFLDLLKSSMNTFLNAMTFPDKTMYPVSSRNEQDFMNLTRVYLDAVFRPAIYTNESIFRQEGWHYELDENGKPFYNGVVFNEMKGALSSVNGLMERIAKKHLFPDNCYGFESGGDPKSIPDLTYESFLSAHREFYSPSNAKIYLDGDVPLERVLTLIDEEYLQGFDYIEKRHDIAPQKPIDETEMTAYYEIGREESEENKTYLSFSRVFASWKERKRIMAFSLLSSYLTDSNESPLKRAILEKGLAQDISFYVEEGIDQPYYTIIFKNTDADKKDAIKAAYTETLQSILKAGIDKEELTAYFNRFEFSLREPEEPAGLERNINALSAWLYGGDMMLYLENDALLKEMREAIDTDYYDTLLAELLDFSHTLTLTMLPSKTKGDEDRQAEEARVNAEYNALSEEEKTAVKATYDAMRKWQDTPDSEEAKATLPVLSLSDVARETMWTPTEESALGDSKLIFHRVDTNGIVHCNLFFDISDEAPEHFAALSLLTDVLGELPTKRRSASELQKEIKKTIGSLSAHLELVSYHTAPQECKVYFLVSVSALKENFSAALSLVKEILTETEYNHPDVIRKNVLQKSEMIYQTLMSAGHLFGIIRATAPTSAASRIQEQTFGFSYLKYLNGFSADFENKAPAFIAFAEEATKRIFVRKRLLIGETAEEKHTALASLAEALPLGDTASGSYVIEEQPPVKEAILIPAGVSFAVSGATLNSLGYALEGKLKVACLMLTYGYLWNEIRVHGGAYGCGFRAGLGGGATFHSYRDPHPLASVKVYRETADFIRNYAESDEPIEKYIISAIAAGEPLVSPGREGYTADTYYLMGHTREDKQRMRTEMLTMTKEDLLSLCPLFEKLAEKASVCIVGNEAALADTADDFTVYRP